MAIQVGMWLGMAGAALTSTAVQGDAAAPSYGRDIAPILAHRCFVCHGPDSSTRKSRLRLDTSKGATEKRGRRPAVIVPGDPQASVLWQRITTDDLEDRMPPADEGHDAIPAEEAALIYAWIEAGAAYETHWSWQPLSPPKVPAVHDASWASGDIDRFVVARLEERGLAPVSQADPAARLRRVHHDLTGLPPSPQVVRAFLADPSRGAWEAQVDQLLADPGFGETWGRHWLDLMRYAQTHGHEFDYPIDEAWRYRDWVIGALNANMPWDQFVREQIAGDTSRQQRVPDIPGLAPPAVATGWWWLSQGTHAPVDVRMDELDRIDNQIDVFSRTFLGTTMACARCHDHKFDAISQKDYYAMVGVIRSSRRCYAYLDPDGRINERVAAMQHAKRQIGSHITGGQKSARAPQSASEGNVVWDFGEDPEALLGWTTSGWSFDEALQPPGSVVMTDGLSVGRVGVGQIHSGGTASGLHGTARSPSFTIDAPYVYVRARGTHSSVRLYVDQYWLNDRNPLLFESMIHAVEDASTWKVFAIDVSRYQGSEAYMELLDDGDGFLAVDWIVHGDAMADDVIGDVAIVHDVVDLDPTLLSPLAALAIDIPAPDRALAMVEGTPADSKVLDRGNPATPLEAANRSLIMAFPSTPHESYSTKSPDLFGSGRPGLADRVLDPANPLTARVAVNRVWHHLMGRGLSTTTDDFGGMGQSPSHPELLDYLASRFQQDWNLKALIKRIVMSRTYSMASTPVTPDMMDIDPDARFLSRAIVRRMSAERLRDAMLVVSGSLDPEVGGPSVPVRLRESMQGRGRPGASGPIDGDNRRSIYQDVRRNFLDPFMTAFDMPVPASTVGRRTVSNVPEQGLMLLNDSMVVEFASRFGASARSQVNEGVSQEEAIGNMIIAAYGRLPRADEVELLVSLSDDTPESWTDIAHALLASAEFRYLY